KGRKNSLQGGLNQNPGLARDDVLLENLVYFMNQLRWLKDFDLDRLSRSDSLRPFCQTPKPA
ncbi:MAG: hypothetical protein ACLFSF_06015, partial [Desulfonatronovibrio sp.]